MAFPPEGMPAPTLLLGSPRIDPEETDHGFRVRNAAITDHRDRFLERQLHDLEKLAGVELSLALLQTLGQKDLDGLIRIADRGVEHAETGPVRRDVAGLFQQLALRGVEVRLARLELARGDLDELARVRIAELPLEEHRAVVEESHDGDRAGMADVLAVRLRAVRKPHRVAVHLEQPAVVDALAGDEMLE